MRRFIIFLSLLGCALSQECSGDEFFCSSSGVCIPNERVCDGAIDCTGGEDEMNCTFSTTIPTTTPCNGFLCPSGRCIPASFICDGDDDCGDMSDEQGCATTSPTPPPSTTPCAFNCNNTGRCLPGQWQCDGDNDCGDWSDEGFQCPCDVGWRCPNNGRCLSETSICDGLNDCIDWSDESEERCVCSEDEIRCPRPPGSDVPGRCIPLEYVCDEEGIWDCPDGFDEANCTTPVSGQRYKTHVLPPRNNKVNN